MASCFRESLKVAASLGASSVAFPAISAGVYGWDALEVATVALDAVSRFDDEGSSGLELVEFVLFSAETAESSGACSRLRKGEGPAGRAFRGVASGGLRLEHGLQLSELSDFRLHGLGDHRSHELHEALGWRSKAKRTVVPPSFSSRVKDPVGRAGPAITWKSSRLPGWAAVIS